MWLPIALTVLAAAGNNIGKVLQKQATRTLPRLSLKREVVVQYLRNRAWVAGTAADLAGALLMIAAFAYAPVSVVQPVSAVGLVILLVFSHFYLKERLKPQEWAAAGVALLGVLGLGVSAEPSHMEHPKLSPARILGVFVLMLGALAAEAWWRQQQQQQLASSRSSLGGRFAAAASSSGSGAQLQAAAGGTQALSSHAQQQATDAIMCGLEAGACFGFSAAACRIGFVLTFQVSALFLPLGLIMSVLLTTSGFVLQTKGLKSGNTVVVCTMAAVGSMTCGVLAGLLALGEDMPSTHAMRLARLASWLLILAGVASLAGGSGGLHTALKAVAAAVLPYLPPGLLPYLPRTLTTALRRLAKEDDEDKGLPT